MIFTTANLKYIIFFFTALTALASFFLIQNEITESREQDKLNAELNKKAKTAELKSLELEKINIELGLSLEQEKIKRLELEKYLTPRQLSATQINKIKSTIKLNNLNISILHVLEQEPAIYAKNIKLIFENELNIKPINIDSVINPGVSLGIIIRISDKIDNKQELINLLKDIFFDEFSLNPDYDIFDMGNTDLQITVGAKLPMSK